MPKGRGAIALGDPIGAIEDRSEAITLRVAFGSQDDLSSFAPLMISNVPGGLGVFETILILLLSPPISSDRLLGPLLAYRGSIIFCLWKFQSQRWVGMNLDSDELISLPTLKNHHEFVTAATQVVTNLIAFKLLFNRLKIMNTPIHPKALLLNDVEVIHNSNSSVTKNTNASINSEVGAFASHRDVRVAIEELLEAGFNCDRITLVARHVEYHNWLDNLTTYDSFPEDLFGKNDIERHFFQRLFQQGKYLLLVSGENNDLKLAGTIMGRRRGHAEVWYVQNDVSTRQF